MLGSWRHWFTFISRAPTHRAASRDFIREVLPVSHGTCFASASLPTRHIEYTTGRRKSQLFILDVKHLKFLYKKKGVSSLSRSSCRPLPISSQPPVGAGAHLYPAQQDSARHRGLHRSGLIRLSWDSGVFPFCPTSL